MFSTTKLFIIIIVVFVLLAVFVIGSNPFSFIEGYLKSSYSPVSVKSLTNPSPSDYIILPQNKGY